MRKGFFILFVLVFLALESYCNQSDYIDFKVATSATIDEIYSSAVKHINNNPDSLFYYADLIQQMSNEINYTKGLINSKYLRGHAFFHMKLYDESAKTLYQGLSIIEQNENEQLELRKILLLQLLALAYEKTYDYSNSIEINKRALIVSHKINDTISLGELYFNIGISKYHLKKFEEAEKLYEKSIPYLESQNNLLMLSRVYNSIGLINKEKQNYSQAINHFNSAIEALDQVSALMNEKIWYIGNIGYCYEAQNELDKAITYYNNALDMSFRLNDLERKKWIFNSLGEIHLKKEAYQQAISYFEKSLALGQTEVFDEEYSRATENIATAYEALGNYQKASQYKDLFIAQSNILEEANQTLYEQIARFRMQEVEWELEKQQKEARIVYISKANLWFKVSMILLAVILTMASYKAVRYYTGIRQVKKWLAEY